MRTAREESSRTEGALAGPEGAEAIRWFGGPAPSTGLLERHIRRWLGEDLPFATLPAAA
jgi:hypothetical protein